MPDQGSRKSAPRRQAGRLATGTSGATVGQPLKVAARQDMATILRLVRAGRAETRQEIELQTGLGRAIVVDRLAALETLGLIEHGDLGAPQGGRAPRLLRFCAKAGSVLVAFLDRTAIGVGVADLSGRLVSEHYEAADLSQGPHAILERVCTLFDWILEQHGGEHKVWGIGLAVPGPLQMRDASEDGAPLLNFDPTWQHFPLIDMLTARYAAPVRLRSNVEAMALGERASGSGGDVSDMIFVKLGEAISAAVISDGHLHRGAQGGAGLIGHMLADPDSREICSCGNRGCLEVVAGGAAIARAGLAAAREGRSPALAEALKTNGTVGTTEVGLASQHGDPVSAELMSSAGRSIGMALASAINLVNPALIVLGGRVAQYGDTLLAAIRETVYRHSHPLVTRDLQIVRSRMGNSGGLLGAASAVLDGYFSEKALRRWVSFGSPLCDPEVVAALGRRAASETAAPPAPAPPLAAGSTAVDE